MGARSRWHVICHYRRTNLVMPLFRTLFLSGCISLSLTTLGYAQKLSIEVRNRTGYNLDSLYIEHHYVGNLKRDSTIIIRQIDTLTIQGMLPLIIPVAVVKEKKMKRRLLKCGTKSRKVSKGYYRFDLHSFEDERGLTFYWTEYE